MISTPAARMASPPQPKIAASAILAVSAWARAAPYISPERSPATIRKQSLGMILWTGWRRPGAPGPYIEADKVCNRFPASAAVPDASPLHARVLCASQESSRRSGWWRGGEQPRVKFDFQEASGGPRE